MVDDGRVGIAAHFKDFHVAAGDRIRIVEFVFHFEPFDFRFAQLGPRIDEQRVNVRGVGADPGRQFLQFLEGHDFADLGHVVDVFAVAPGDNVFDRFLAQPRHEAHGFAGGEIEVEPAAVAVDREGGFEIDAFEHFVKSPDQQQFLDAVEFGIVARRIARLEILVILVLGAFDAFEFVQVGPVGPGHEQFLDPFRVGVEPAEPMGDEHLHVLAVDAVEIDLAGVVVDAHDHIFADRIVQLQVPAVEAIGGRSDLAVFRQFQRFSHGQFHAFEHEFHFGVAHRAHQFRPGQPGVPVVRRRLGRQPHLRSHGGNQNREQHRRPQDDDEDRSPLPPDLHNGNPCWGAAGWIERCWRLRIRATTSIGSPSPAMGSNRT